MVFLRTHAKKGYYTTGTIRDVNEKAGFVFFSPVSIFACLVSEELNKLRQRSINKKIRKVENKKHAVTN